MGCELYLNAAAGGYRSLSTDAAPLTRIETGKHFLNDIL